MRRNPDLLAVIAIALYLWVGAVHPNAAPEPRPTANLRSAQVREALRSEVRNALHEIAASFKTFH